MELSQCSAIFFHILKGFQPLVFTQQDGQTDARKRFGDRKGNRGVASIEHSGVDEGIQLGQDMYIPCKGDWIMAGNFNVCRDRLSAMQASDMKYIVACMRITQYLGELKIMIGQTEWIAGFTPFFRVCECHEDTSFIQSYYPSAPEKTSLEFILLMWYNISIENRGVSGFFVSV